MARPLPVPRAPSRRGPRLWKTSKIRSWCSFTMPRPLSRTTIRWWSASSRTSTTIIGSAGLPMWSRALPIRLLTRWERRRVLGQGERGALRFETRFQLGVELEQQVARIDGGARRPDAADARELQQVADQRLHRPPRLLDPLPEMEALAV